MNISSSPDKSDVIVIGAGLAGLVTCLELLQRNVRVSLIDAGPMASMGGLANWAFGGMALIDSPLQRKKKIRDSKHLALQDWLNYADFDNADHWPKKWAEYYIEYCIPEVYEYVTDLNMSFLPAVNWAERTGNTVPRYHILWGCSLRLIEQLKQRINLFSANLYGHFNTRIVDLDFTNGRVTGCHSDDISFNADAIVVATGGFGGSIERVKNYWPADWLPLKQDVLNGCHPSNDGQLAHQLTQHGAVLSHMENMWNYAAGIAHPQASFESQGLSLIPCRSALWITPSGERIMPPLVGGFDTVELCKTINQTQQPYTWQILNRTIALKELAISGSEHNPAIRDRNWLRFVKELLLGNHDLLQQMCGDSEDFIVADSLQELALKMQQLTKDSLLQTDLLIQSVKVYDELLYRKDSSDLQIQQLLKIREYFPDRFRTLSPQSMLKKPPYIAIRLRLISRKSMGGLVTNLDSQMVDAHDQIIPGLYGVGEAAGFGGGGASGKKSLEGTFLSGCILSGRQAARSLV